MDEEALRELAEERLRALAGPEAALREDQWAAIRALVLERRRALVVQRTGWGKSAVYFIATALLRELGEGPTVIVSPLLALMRNQVAAAANAEVHAATINSANPEEWADIEERVAAGEVDVLLVSPERLNNPDFRDTILPELTQSAGLLVVDEAQGVPYELLEEIRLLANIETTTEKLLGVVLAGQPELSRKLDSPRLQQLMQRVRLRFHLGTLSKRETHEYITHRLNVAGANGRTIFQPSACDIVFRYAGGVPRLINVLCDTAMLCAFAEERTVVDDALVKAAVEELQWVDFSERLRAQEQRLENTGKLAGLRGSPLARLEILHRDQLVGEFRLDQGRAIIGRTPDNDVQIQSRFVSRHHAQVVSDRQQSVLEDLNSTNGVFIRAQRVKQQVLADGDIIQIGEHKLLYRDMRGALVHRLVAVDDDEEDDDVEDEEAGDELDEVLDEKRR